MLLVFIDVGVLVLGAELIVLALLAYYVKMMGHYRIRIALGGMSLGMGGLTPLIAYLIGTASALFYVLIFVSVVSIIAGVLNVTAKPRD